jgi:GTP-binding protein YchF
MKIGIVGHPQSGKTTIFNTLTGSTIDTGSFQGKKEPNLSVVDVPDVRIEKLTELYNPKKTINAQVHYLDIAVELSPEREKEAAVGEIIKLLRNVDALLLVIKNFELHGMPPTPQADYDSFESELILSDLISIENRLTKLEKEFSKGKKGDPKELELLRKANELLNQNKPLRNDLEIVNSPLLKGFTFLSSKPCIVIINSGDDAILGATKINTEVVEIKGRLEMELSQLTEDEAQIFREEMGLTQPATQKIIEESYKILGLISFFTVGEDEVRAWTIKRDSFAPKAAGAIHSDIEKGFIRAEVVFYDDLMGFGTYTAAQKAGKVRLEGKDYIVKDGDIINFRFNV